MDPAGKRKAAANGSGVLASLQLAYEAACRQVLQYMTPATAQVLLG
jgi:hypothetical protein